MSPVKRTSDDFNTLFQYNRWANERVLATLRGAEDVPSRAIELFSHLLRSQEVWYGRVRDTDHADLDLWVQDTVSVCAEQAESSARHWNQVLQECSVDDLGQPVSYTNSKGTSFETPLRDILTHVVNHSTHHRAQIALVLRQAEIAPPVTDYIFYVREQ